MGDIYECYHCKNSTSVTCEGKCFHCGYWPRVCCNFATCGPSSVKHVPT